MRKEWTSGAGRYLVRKRRHRIWLRVVSSLACVVVFCTVYALILPAITMENKPQCGKEEHTHTDECYRRLGAAAAPAQPVLDCTLNSLGIHQHTADCYDAGGALICGYADYVLHIHDGRCYDETDALVCTLPEIREHVHTDACYRAAEPEPVQDPQPAREPICGKQEAEGHTHTDACYQTERELTCTLPETEGHVHGEACRDETGTLICTLTEAEGHTHNDSCYTEKKTLICTVEESEGHTHTETCYPAAPEQAAEQLQPQEQATEQEQARELICAIPEAALHTHDETCYTGGVLTCGRLQTTAHQHTDACFHAPEAAPAPQPELTCTIPEGEGAHTHSQEAGCYDENGKLICETEESAGHQHGPRCYGTWELVCQLEEHTHAEECFLKDGLTAGEWAQIDAVSAKLNALPIRGEIEEKLMALDVAGDEAGYDAYMIQLAQAVREARAAYDALTETQKQKIADAARLEELSWLLTSADDSGDTAEDWLEADLAYIENLNITNCQSGAGTFDVTVGPGNDTSVDNDILRTFDLATYELTFTTAAKNGANIGGYKHANVCFQFVLPVSSEKAQFEMDSMAWLPSLKANNQADYTFTESGGQQVLEGWFTIQPSDNNPSVIPCMKTVTAAVRALNMKNDDTLTPTFIMWLQPNTDTAERKTASKSLTISALAQYNVELISRPHSSNIASGTYDFNAAGSGAQNYGKGQLEGLMAGVGVTLQLRSDKNRGMLGMQMPDAGTTITFDLQLSSVYKAQGVTVDTGGNYPLLLWSGGGNSNGDTAGRETRTIYNEIVDVPYNQYQNPTGSYEYNACHNGGTWQFSQDGDTIHVTVSGFTINTDRFPYGAARQLESYHKYYSGNGITGNEPAVFSAGELWLFQTYQNLTTKVKADKEFEAGQFVMGVKDAGNLKVNGIDTVQTSSEDDATTWDRGLGGGGDIGVILSHEKYSRGDSPRPYQKPLTEGGFNYDFDWAAAGERVSLYANLMQSNSEGNGRAAAVDFLVKFDGDFLEPEEISYYPSWDYYASRTYLWVTKPDGTNWVNDEEMKSATEDDLVYYAKLEEIPAGHIPVGVLMEIRGIRSGQLTFAFYIDGKIKETSAGNGGGEVYMVTRANYIWTVSDVAEFLGINTEEMTDRDINEVVKARFPSRDPSKTGPKQQLTGDHLDWLSNSVYPEPSSREDYYVTPELHNCTKASYEGGVHHSGYKPNNYEDSCLVLPYRTTITKSTAQTNTDGSTKKTYTLDSNERYVDFVLQPKIEGYLATGDAGAKRMDVQVTVRDILPEGLSYANGTAYLGGTYQQTAGCTKPGTVTNGTPLQTGIGTENGKTVLEWTFTATVDLLSGQATELPPIHFSCQILDEKLTGLQASLTNDVTIKTGGELFRGYDAKYGNVAECPVTVVRSTGASISKLADQHNADWWAPVGFLMNAGNNSSYPLSDTLIAETLPKNGQDGTTYDGSLVVTELLLGSKKNETLLSNFKFYYTTDPAYAGLTGADLRQKLSKADGATWQAYLRDSSDWIELSPSGAPQATETQGETWYATAATGLPGETNQKSNPITAIVAAGNLPASRTLKMHITVKLPNGKAGDNLVNYLSMSVGGNDLSVFARTNLVSRSLAGLTWLDKNADGIQNETADDYLSGITVSLWKLEEGATDPTNLNSYEPCCYPGTTTPIVIQTGQKVSAQAEGSGKIAAYNKGQYLFTDLPSGVYAVKFTSGDASSDGILLENYHPSPENEGTDDAVDSDGVPTLDSDHVLQSTAIVNIDLQDASGISVSEHNDSGFYRRGTELPMTGGSGAYWQTFCGLALMAGPLVCWTHKRRRGAERR